MFSRRLLLNLSCGMKSNSAPYSGMVGSWFLGKLGNLGLVFHWKVAKEKDVTCRITQIFTLQMVRILIWIRQKNRHGAQPSGSVAKSSPCMHQIPIWVPVPNLAAPLLIQLVVWESSRPKTLTL